MKGVIQMLTSCDFLGVGGEPQIFSVSFSEDVSVDEHSQSVEEFL